MIKLITFITLVLVASYYLYPYIIDISNNIAQYQMLTTILTIITSLLWFVATKFDFFDSYYQKLKKNNLSV